MCRWSGPKITLVSCEKKNIIKKNLDLFLSKKCGLSIRANLVTRLGLRSGWGAVGPYFPPQRFGEALLIIIVLDWVVFKETTWKMKTKGSFSLYLLKFCPTKHSKQVGNENDPSLSLCDGCNQLAFVLLFMWLVFLWFVTTWQLHMQKKITTKAALSYHQGWSLTRWQVQWSTK